MKHDNQLEEQLVELGGVAADTKGNGGKIWEPVGLDRLTGISDD